MYLLIYFDYKVTIPTYVHSIIRFNSLNTSHRNNVYLSTTYLEYGTYVIIYLIKESIFTYDE